MRTFARGNLKIYIYPGGVRFGIEGGVFLWDVIVCVDSSVIDGGVSHRTKWASGGGGVSLTYVYTHP
jgi:hypothetical protein